MKSYFFNSRISLENINLIRAAFSLNCHVCSFFTDNSAMVKMRKSLETKTKDCINVVCFDVLCIFKPACKRFGIFWCTEHVIKIIKYFCNNQFARAKFNENKEEKVLALVYSYMCIETTCFMF